MELQSQDGICALEITLFFFKFTALLMIKYNIFP